MFRPTICIDFDGVIHSYKSGWDGAAEPPDPPVPGAAEAIVELRKKYKVIIYSARCHLLGGKEAIETWMAKYGIEVDAVQENKPPAIIYLDDRGIQFHGNWRRALSDIEHFHWWMGNNEAV